MPRKKKKTEPVKPQKKVTAYYTCYSCGHLSTYDCTSKNAPLSCSLCNCIIQSHGGRVWFDVEGDDDE